jgi:hypothetical protein
MEVPLEIERFLKFDERLNKLATTDYQLVTLHK